jgi:hypothetical protein
MVSGQKMVLGADADGWDNGVSPSLRYPIDIDMAFDGQSEGLAADDWVGCFYRNWSAGAWWLRGYVLQAYGDGKVRLVFNPGERVVAETTISKDWTQVHRFRVRAVGPRHSAWIDDQLLWENVEDWGWLEYGYAGITHHKAQFTADNFYMTYDRRIEMPQTATPVTSVVGAKALDAGTAVSLAGPVVTAQFNGFFYVEDPLRTSGIKVKSTTTVAEGTIPTIEGKTATLDGEVFIDATNVTPGPAAPEAVKTVAMTNKANAPLVGLSNIGLLSTVYGKVLEVAADGTYCYVDDGSGVSYETGKTGIKVMIAGTKKPLLGNYVSCTGIARKASATVPVISMRSDADLVIMKQ